MDGQNTRIVVSAEETRLEIEGSEAFVEKQLRTFGKFVEAVLQSKQKPKGQTKVVGSTKVKDGSPEENKKEPEGLTGYDHVFAFADDKIQVIVEIPGSTKSEQMVNAALLLAFGNTLAGAKATTFDAVRDLCKRHGCLDGPNLAKRLKAEKQAFLFGGTVKKQILELTVPGRKRAEALVESLQA